MQSTKRPNGVWLILIVYFGSVISTLRWLWRIYNERLPVSAATAERLLDPGAADLTLMVIGLILAVAFLVALFKMRRVAIALFTTYIALVAISNVILFNKHRSSFQEFSLVEVVAPVVVLLVTLAAVGLTYFYLRTLAREGQLT